MTHNSDNAHRMQLLAKVARGLDLPPPAASVPVQPAALLPDEDIADEQMRYPAESTAEPQAGESAADSGKESRSSESDPVAPAMPEAAGNNFAALSAPSRVGRIRSALHSQAIMPKSDPSIEPDADSTSAGSELKSPPAGRPASLPTAAAPSSEKYPGPAGHLQAPAGTSSDEEYSAADTPRRVPRGRWFFHHGERHQSRTPRQASRMLQPVFEPSAEADRADPAVIPPREALTSPERTPEADRAGFAAQSSTSPAGRDFSVHQPHRQPPDDPRGQTPSVNAIEAMHGMGRRPAIDQPVLNAGPPAAGSAVSSKPGAPDRLRHEIAAEVRRVAPAAQAAIIDNSRPGAAAFTSGAPSGKTEQVSIGKINIQVRGKRQPEDDWPAPPRYAAHKITEDWEWSCHYGK